VASKLRVDFARISLGYYNWVEVREMMLRRSSIVFALVFVAISVAACAQPPAPQLPNTAAWGYYGSKGPSNWGRLDPAYSACSKGKDQSPIDIRGTKTDRALKPIEFHYLSGPVTLFNTGNTIQGIVGPGSYIVANGVRYDLQQFHFHRPSEHLVKGKVSDLEIHLVHKSADGKFAVIAVRVNEGRVNGSLAAIWPSLPKAPGATAPIRDPFNPLGLLPTDRAYWTYTGSLTEPPCTEGVQWFVLEDGTELAGDQLSAFAAIYQDNARQVQDPHGRKVESSE